jgi:hypothetical protein
VSSTISEPGEAQLPVHEGIVFAFDPGLQRDDRQHELGGFAD